jgi:hypothetical protein
MHLYQQTTPVNQNPSALKFESLPWMFGRELGCEGIGVVVVSRSNKMGTLVKSVTEGSPFAVAEVRLP